MSSEDDFGGFEEAPTSVLSPSNNSTQVPIDLIKTKKENIPEWLIGTSHQTTDQNLLIKDLQDELNKTKEQLIDQQTSYLQLQAQQRQETNSLTQVYKDIQLLLIQQKEHLRSEFLNIQAENEKRFNQHLKELSIKFENKLAEFQENLIKHYDSEFEDLELKIKKIINSSIKEELLQNEKLKLEKIENELKMNSEKLIQNYFRNQSEVYKEQIKSGVLQEHLIHRDMINNKLEKLFKSSEEKRRKTNMLFAKHMSGLNFFVDNAHKQLEILKEAHQDLLKNKELVDYYANDSNSTKSLSQTSLSNLGLHNLNLDMNNNNQKSQSKDNLYELEDENLIIQDLI